MEGGVYYAFHELVDGVWRLTLADKRDVVSENQNLEVAKDELAEAIMEWNGDGEAVIELMPPLDADGYRRVGYNESARCIIEPSRLYLGGVCPLCGSGIGARTDIEMKLDDYPAVDVLGIDGLRPAVSLLSERLYSAVVSREPLLKGRAVYSKGRTFMEISGAPVVATVPVKGHVLGSVFGLWRCSSCGRTAAKNSGGKYATYTTEVAQSALVSRGWPKVMIVDSGLSQSICVRVDVWQDIVGGIRLVKVPTRAVNLIADEDVDTQAVIPEPNEFPWMEKKKGRGILQFR